METDWGLCRISDTMLIDQTEILIQEWLDFIFYQNIKEFNFYTFWKEPITGIEKEKLLNTKIDASLLPDKNILDQLPEKYLFNKCNNCQLIKVHGVATEIQLPFEADSLNNEESKKRLLRYLMSPVVGISYKQAVRFCEWRTAADSIRYSLRNNKDNPLIRSPYIFRLPTPEEFDKLNPSSDSIFNKKGFIARYNYKNAKYSLKKNKQSENMLCGSSSMPAASFVFARTNTLLTDPVDDIQGNVAEMTSIIGTAKGGSFYHYGKESFSGKNNQYTQPEPWLGFRCVVVKRIEK